MPTVFLVADDASRGQLAERLTGLPLRVLGHGSSFADAIASAADVIVVFGTSPLDTRHRAGEFDLPPVLIVSDELAALRLAARLGAPAWGVVPHAASAADVSAAVEALARGLVVVPADRASRLAPRDAADDDDVALDEPLTARERDVLELLAEGLPNREIARVLGISEHTVKYHLAAVFGKLGASTRTHAVRRGLRKGIIGI